MKTKFSKWDILPIAAVLALALAVFFLFLPPKGDADYVEIYQNGKVLAILPLDRDGSYTARMANNFVVKFTDESDCLDRFVTLKITGKKGTSLTAQLLNK